MARRRGPPFRGLVGRGLALGSCLLPPLLALLGARGSLDAGWASSSRRAPRARPAQALAGRAPARRGRRRPAVALRADYYDDDDDDGGEFGGSILEQLEALDEQDPLAENVIDKEWSHELEQRVQLLKDNHQRAVDDGRLMGHAPVLLYTAMEFMFQEGQKQDDRRYNGVYADCTFGRGGHTREILARLSDEGRLYAFDIDPDALEIGRALEREDSRFRIFHRPYADIHKALEGVELDGVVMDIGVSSPQLDEWSRGFSLQNLDSVERPLDLRMNPESGVSAMEWLQTVSVEELARVLQFYGPDGHPPLSAERVAQAIIDDQELNGPYTSMKRFAEVIVKASSSSEDEDDFEHPVIGALHPAKLWVHAVRLYLNQELEQLEAGLGSVLRLLKPGGRLVVACFKRRESQTIERWIMDHEEPDPETVARVTGKRRLVELYPLVGTDYDYSVRLVGGKPIKASNFEINRNRRARSGSLFVIEKAPRLTKQVKAKPRLLRNRFREPGKPVLVQDPEEVEVA